MIYIGTSGWSYPGWEEKFYHMKLSSLEQLEFYAAKFNTVEINYSFYHIPKAETFRKWAQATPERFVFSIKLNRQFTHVDHLELTEGSLSKLQTFLQNSRELGDKFKILLIQTPKSFRYDFNRLEKFLRTAAEIIKNLHLEIQLVFEFRNEDWYSEKIYSLLKQYQATLVISQSKLYPERRVVISDLIYIRLHGPDKIFDSSYSHEQLDDWKEFLQQHTEAKNAYVYFNNTMSGQAIDDALYLQL